MYDVIIIGAGPGGIFAAISAKNVNKNLKILVLEKSKSILSKVKISGGGRCNVTNANFDLKDLCKNYPRGQKELLGAFYQFGPSEMIDWLEKRGVSLNVEKDRRVFPVSDDSQTIIDCFLKEIKKQNIEIKCNQNIESIIKKENEIFEITLDTKEKYLSKKVILATGSSPIGINFAKDLGHKIETFIPALFSFKIEKSNILQLSGLSQENVRVSIKSSSCKQVDSILITHEGFSGPAILKLSSFVAKFLHEKKYRATLLINWLDNFTQDQIFQKLIKAKEDNSKRSLFNLNLFNFPQKLWFYFLSSFGSIFDGPMCNISKKNLMKLTAKLSSDEHAIISKSMNKSEFVSCGGINLKEVNFKDMQSKRCPNLYFVGEILNIDGLTGGYNFQNAWTTGFIAGNSS